GLIRFAQGLAPALLCRPYPRLECCAFNLVSRNARLQGKLAERGGFEPPSANNRKPSFSVLYVAG
ncbi:MAG TPA: hypothetical protein VK961_27410, partial [Chthoniobacter sp.]|nr:hypothetical protein [Chthoniobacter sp.]